MKKITTATLLVFLMVGLLFLGSYEWELRGQDKALGEDWMATTLTAQMSVSFSDIDDKLSVEPPQRRKIFAKSPSPSMMVPIRPTRKNCWMG